MFTNRGAYINLLVAQLVRKTRAIGKESDFLDHPMVTVCAMLLLGDDAALCIALAGGNRDGFAANAPGPD
jgi:hypothetical protein